jgi:hypothetical protein
MISGGTIHNTIENRPARLGDPHSGRLNKPKLADFSHHRRLTTTANRAQKTTLYVNSEITCGYGRHFSN